jgi:hypothetical protein
MRNSLPYRPVKLTIICASIALLVVLASVSEAQTNQDERWENGFTDSSWSLPTAPKEEVAALTSRWKAIEEELRSTPNEFAGTYRDGGDMRGSVLRWAPESGFVYVSLYEWLDVLDFSYGKVTVTPSEIIFTVEREQQTTALDNRPRTTPLRWVAARVNQNNYLIPVELMSDFGDYLAGFGKYNDFNGPCCEFTPFLTVSAKVNSKEKSRSLTVPNEYKFFLKQPIEATITYVGQRKIVENYGSEGELYGHLHLRAALTTVKINAGKNRGVKRGLLFRLLDIPNHYGQYLKITRVGSFSSQGVVVRDVDDDGKETYYDSNPPEKRVYPPVISGMRVTTSPL